MKIKDKLKLADFMIKWCQRENITNFHGIIIPRPKVKKPHKGIRQLG